MPWNGWIELGIEKRQNLFLSTHQVIDDLFFFLGVDLGAVTDHTVNGGAPFFAGMVGSVDPVDAMVVLQLFTDECVPINGRSRSSSTAGNG